MSFFPKNYSKEDYEHDFQLLKLIPQLRNNLNYQDCDPEARKQVFAVYDRVYSYSWFFVYRYLFSAKELSFQVFEANLDNFTNFTESNFMTFVPLSQTIYSSKKQEYVSFWTKFWKLLELDESASLFRTKNRVLTLDGLKIVIDTVKYCNREKKPFNKDTLDYFLESLNFYRMCLHESLAARHTLAKIFEELKGFDLF